MKYISPTQLFNEQVFSLGKEKGKIVLKNLLVAEKIIKDATRFATVKNLSMILKVKDSKYSIQYLYDINDGKLLAEKLRLMKR